MPSCESSLDMRVSDTVKMHLSAYTLPDCMSGVETDRGTYTKRSGHGRDGRKPPLNRRKGSLSLLMLEVHDFPRVWFKPDTASRSPALC